MIYNAVTFLEGLFLTAGVGTESKTAQPLPQVRWSDTGVEDLPGDWRVWFEERAAIMEYEGGLPREQAEAKALAETLRLMKMEK